MVPVVKSLRDYQAYQINPDDRNRLAIVFDPTAANASLTVCVEIFEAGATVPFHQHRVAVEMFFILKGEAIAVCDGKAVKLQTGDSILVPPQGIHSLENIGSTRLYALCIMVPNEDFIELIRNGTAVKLDEEDLRVLSRTDNLFSVLPS
ncbi:MAG: cupin domain-containing protein [Microcoleaceae cyanobacterium]